MRQLLPGRHSRWHTSIGGLLLLLHTLALPCQVPGQRGLEAQPGVHVFIDNTAAGVTGDGLLLGSDGLGPGVAAADGGLPAQRLLTGPQDDTAAAAAMTAAELGSAAMTAGGGADPGLPSGGHRRRLLASYPSSVTNGSASATFPAASFAAWCAADATCAAAGDLSLTLFHHTDASPFTAATLNWPTVFSGAGVSSLQLVSAGVVELQFTNYPNAAKQDQLICGAASAGAGCTAQLSVPINASAVIMSRSFVCLRLEPSVTGSSYQAYGYPNGSNGLSVEATVVNGAMRCNTNRFGKHIIMQYKQSALLPPSPSPPPSPPPPPPLDTAGATFTSDVQLRLTLPLSIGFDTLKANETLLSELTSSLESSLASYLVAARVPLLLSYDTTISSKIYKISRWANSTATAVSVEFRLVVSAGVTEGQVGALMQRLAENSAALFNGSSYTRYFLSSGTVSYISSGSSNGLGTGAVVGIALGAMFGTMLLLLGGYALYRWRSYVAILPKKPEGDWDATGVAVTPRKTARRRKVQRERLASQDPPSPPSPPPPLGAPTAEGWLRSGGELLWDHKAQAADGAGAEAPSVKSQARLVSPTKQAWS